MTAFVYRSFLLLQVYFKTIRDIFGVKTGFDLVNLLKPCGKGLLRAVGEEDCVLFGTDEWCLK